MSGSNRGLNPHNIPVLPPSQRLADLAEVACNQFVPIEYLSKVARSATVHMRRGAALATVCAAFTVAGGILMEDKKPVGAPLLFGLLAAAGAATARTRRQEAEALILTAQTSARTRQNVSPFVAHQDALQDVSRQRREFLEKLSTMPGARAKIQMLPGLGGLFQSR